MFDQKDIDVIIPCAGTAEYFEIALDSALSQICKPQNIYVLDNACQHLEYKKIVEKKNDSCIKYIRFDTRLLMTENWQRCLTVGTNPLVAFLHDDDYWSPEYLESSVALLNRNEKSFMCFTGYVNFEGSIDSVQDILVKKCKENYDKIQSLNEPVRAFYISSCNFGHMSAIVFKRAPIGFLLSSVWMPDQIFLANYLQTYEYEMNSDVNVLIRQSSSNVTSALKHHGFISVETIKHLRDQIAFYLRGKNLDVYELVKSFPVDEYQGYYHRLTQASFSWPIRPALLNFGLDLLSAKKGKAKNNISLLIWIQGWIWVVKCLLADVKYYFKDVKKK
ncbi:glycosyltransferase family 2 protein [Cytophaga aurantiaca]|uniref:glycosyltransferase family 2 protein n=1 Tax=Cytophaga aurantiaca TaxID=29530 RepID=UPI00037F19E4|nr:glycosyltransferase [Cytophaga aurantiaca]